MRARTFVAALLLLAALQLSLLAAPRPRGTITVKATGTRYEDVEFERDPNGKEVHVWTKFGKATFKLGDVVILENEDTGPKPGEEEEVPEGAGVVLVPAGVDLPSRCMLEPPPEWDVVKGDSPLVRIQLRHQKKDALLLVTTRPAPGGDFAFGKNNQGEATAITKDLESQFAKVTGSRPAPATLWGAPVYRLENVRVLEYGRPGQEKTLSEVRFRRHGLEYAVSLLLGRDAQGAFRADELLGSFSFLPPLAEHDGALIDFVRGFAFARPSAEWQLLAQPFEEETPIKAVFDGGRGELTVRLVKLQKGRTAADLVNDLIAARRKASSYFDLKDQGNAVRDGLEVTSFHFEDFRDGGKVRMVYKGFGAAIGEQGLLFVGIAPITDQDAAKIQADVDRSLAGVRLLDTQALTAEVLNAQNALSLVSQGSLAYEQKRYPEAVDQLTKALELVPTYARALYLRALAKQAQSDFKGFAEDLEQASQLDPTGNYDEALIPAYEKEAAEEANKKNWARAADLRLKVFRARKDDKQIAAWITCLRGLWADAGKEKAYDRGLRDLELRAKDLLSRPDVLVFMKSTIKEGVGYMIKERDFGKARKWAGKLKRMDSDPKAKAEADTLLKQIGEAEKRGK